MSHSLLSSPSQLDDEELGQLLTQFLRPPPAFQASVIVLENSSSIQQSSESGKGYQTYYLASVLLAGEAKKKGEGKL